MDGWRPSVTVGEIIEQLGIAEQDGEQVTLVVIDGGTPRHYRLAELLDADPADAPALYLASGTFRAGTVTRWAGRSEGNVARILWLPFDCDLADWLSFPDDPDERKAEYQWLWSRSDDELLHYIDLQRADLLDIFARAGLPVHRLDYTGYGLCAYVRLDEADQTRVSEARKAHKLLVKRLNDLAGYRLVDPQVSDAGTRITRLPDSLNNKGAIPRRVRTLATQPGSCPLDSRPAPVQPIARMIPRDGSGLAETDVEALVSAVAPAWTQGQKHAMALGLGGMLAKAGIPESQALAIVERLSASDALPGKKSKAVADSYARVRSGLPCAGFTRLRELMGADAVAFVDGILERFRLATKPTITLGGVASSVAPMKRGKVSSPVSLITDRPIPEACLVGWLKDYVDLVEPLCEAPICYHLASGLALAGATFGRTVSARYVSKSLYANVYMMLIGSAGTSRKDTAIRLAVELPTHTGAAMRLHQAPFEISTDVGSAEGLVKRLSQHANTLLYITEYQRISRQAKRQSTGTIFPLLTAAWDAPVKLENVTKGNPLEAKFPYLTVLAAVQPGILAEEMQQEDISSGFATRWLYVPGVGQDARPEPPDIDSRRAFDLYDQLLQLRRDYEVHGETRLYLSEAAKQRWIAWYEEDRAKPSISEDEESMRSRLGVHVRKIALIYAATEGAGQIEERHLDPAFAFVEWCWEHTRELMRGWGIGVWSQIEERIEKVLRDRGPMSRRQLQQLCRGRRWSSREFTMVLEPMIRNGTVEADVTGQLSWGGE